MNRLTEFVEVKITANDDQEREYWVTEIAKALAVEAGGFTIRYNDIGGWVNGNGELVTEPSIAIRAYCQEAEKVYQAIAPLVGRYGLEANQEAVIIVVNDQAIIAEPQELV